MTASLRQLKSLLLLERWGEVVWETFQGAGAPKRGAVAEAEAEVGAKAMVEVVPLKPYFLSQHVARKKRERRR